MQYLFSEFESNNESVLAGVASICHAGLDGGLLAISNFAGAGTTLAGGVDSHTSSSDLTATTIESRMALSSHLTHNFYSAM